MFKNVPSFVYGCVPLPGLHGRADDETAAETMHCTNQRHASIWSVLIHKPACAWRTPGSLAYSCIEGVPTSTCACRSSEDVASDGDAGQVDSDHASNQLPPNEVARQMEEPNVQKHASYPCGDRAKQHQTPREEAVHSRRLVPTAKIQCMPSEPAHEPYPGFHPASIAEAMRWFIKYEALLAEDSEVWMRGKWFGLCPKHVQSVCKIARAGALTVTCGQSTEAASWAMRAATTCGISAYFTITPSGQCEIDLVRSSRSGAPALRTHTARDKEGTLRPSASAALSALVSTAQHCLANGLALRDAIMSTVREATEGARAAVLVAKAPGASMKKRCSEQTAAVLRSVKHMGAVGKKKKKTNSYNNARGLKMTYAAAIFRNMGLVPRQNKGPGGEHASVRLAYHRSGIRGTSEPAVAPALPEHKMHHVAFHSSYNRPSWHDHGLCTRPAAFVHSRGHQR